MPKAKSKAFTRIRAEVLRIVAGIPPGHFTTYGTIAHHMRIRADAATQRARLQAEGLKISRQGCIVDADAHYYYVGPRRNIRWSEG